MTAPAPARWITYPHRVDPAVLGEVKGPLYRSSELVTIVAVEGRRVGMAYGTYCTVCWTRVAISATTPGPEARVYCTEHAPS